MKKILFILFFLILGISAFAQYDDPAAYTQYYGFRLWEQGDAPGADSLNANWEDIDFVLHDLVVYADPEYFTWLEQLDEETVSVEGDTLTLKSTAFGDITFAPDSNLILPLHSSPYTYLDTGAVAYTSSGYLIWRNPKDGTIDTFATYEYLDSENFANVYAGVDSIILNTNKFGSDNGSPTHLEGLIWYDSTRKAMVVYNDEEDVSQEIGREFYIRVYNSSGVSIANGEAVIIDSSSSPINHCPCIEKAEADSIKKINVIGLATHTIPDGEYGYVTTKGLVGGIDLSSFSGGDVLYLDTLAGNLTNVEPVPPYPSIRVGWALSDSTSGDVLVSIQETSYDQTVYAQNFIRNERDHGFYAYEDSSVTISIGTQNTWYQMTNATGNLFTAYQDNEGFTISGDTIYFNTEYSFLNSSPHLKFSWNTSGEGTSGSTYEFRIYNVTDGSGVPVKSIVTGGGGAVELGCGSIAYDSDSDNGDVYVLQVRNITGTGDWITWNSGIFVEVSHY